MRSLGEATETLFSEIVKDHPYDWYRIVKGILHLRKTYSDEVIDLSPKRALAYGITHYSKVKRICESGCYHLPLPDICNKEELSWKL